MCNGWGRYTSREHTCYVARVLKKDVPWAMEFLSDILLHSNYDTNAVNAERGTILREMEEVNKDMREVIFDNLHATAYHGQALGNTILGPVDNINSITRDDLSAFVKANYTAQRMNAIVVGDVDHAHASDLATKYFGSVSAQPRAAVQARSTAQYIGSDIRERNDDVSDIHFAIGFESFGAKSADSVALMVMQTLLGEWSAASSVGTCSSSELCRTVAEHGLAQQVSAFSTQYSDTGLFGVYGVGNKDSITDLIWATQVKRKQRSAACACVARNVTHLQRCILNLAHTVSDDDVARATAMLKASILASSEGTNATCEEIGRQLVGFGRHLSLAEMFARIDQVDANTVRRVAGDIINDRDHVCSSHGPVGFSGADSMPDYTWMRRRNYMLRY
jgi:processing peptidase subunit beta